MAVQDLEKIPISFASVSIGYSSEHTLPKKLDAIAAAGFRGIELGFPDLQAFATKHLRPQQQDESSPKEVAADDYDSLVSVAKLVRSMCDAKGLKIMLLQPFANFEGWADGSPEKEEAWSRVKGWVRIMEAAGIETLQAGSTDSPQEKIGKDRGRFVKDLQELADYLADHKLRVAYENWCWSTHAPDWKDVWYICQKVNRPNFGLCLDTFQSAGGEWADPSTASGLIEDGRSSEQVQKDWKASCDELARTVPADKIYLLQISDAYKPQPGPIPKEGVDGMRARGFWSHAYRPLPFKGYLPTIDFAHAVIKTGFRDWFSTEIFDAGSDGRGKEYDLVEFAKEAAQTHKMILDEVRKADGV
ncbi:putative 4-hydroxyphenylpyruvate dioxygenase [Teratosphaeria nubilosa]|uniref:Putative 4-hydroxyphenylpyruvate dioxygenase n=1 Tax=Teratosphaeria nubilosa TaxID=161662 RepID=A0A6G1LAL7_9PEZI|nr:putative 4-hydroxyphenylpyruvate dioxygenase [Teratosphaeria nubilosa]